MPAPALSVIIPAFNRPAPLIDTLASVRQLQEQLSCEIILVDDGSKPGLAQQLPPTALKNAQVVVQQNSGSIQARLNGLQHASGDFVKFLDSDDLLEVDGVVAQLGFLQQTSADIVYGVIRNCQTSTGNLGPSRRLSINEFVLQAQPPPHAPLFRRSSLQTAALPNSRLPTDHVFCATGDVWLYASLLGHNWDIRYLPGYVGSVPTHAQGRYSDNWEQLGLVGGCLLWCLAVLHAEHPELRLEIARKALGSLIKLPLGVPRKLDGLYRAIWQRLDPQKRLIGEYQSYQRVSRLLGFNAALWCARKRRRTDYAAIQTMTISSMDSLIIKLGQALQSHDFPLPWQESRG